MKKVLAIALAAALLPTEVAAQEATTIEVTTSDLDLSTKAGQQRLDARIDRASRSICATTDRSLWAQRMAAACRTEVRAKAESQVAFAIGQARATRLADLQNKPNG